MRTREIDDSLSTYRRKRDFSDTPEPAGKRPRRGRRLSYVIQKHAARSLHYDFRLELDGTLKSWAVPKGPSLDPHDRRLAMQVEDHPLEYGDFEGVIPEGNYGAGTVIIWDRGWWEPIGDAAEGYRQGKLTFRLHGEKLSGLWHLVRGGSRGGKSTRPAWFLLKRADDAARPAAEFNITEAEPDSVAGGAGGRVWQSNRSTAPRAAEQRAPGSSGLALPHGAKRAPLPLTIAPQLATLVDKVPARGSWEYEVKFDGYRLLARLDGDAVHLFTRNGNDWSKKLPHLVAALRTLNIQGWLDGEITVPDERGYPSFQRLQNAFENANTADIQFYLFDLMYLDGCDLRALPLRERRALLRRLLGENPPKGLYFSENFSAPAAELLQRACAMRLEGLIGKRSDLGYHSGRSPDWIKLKCLHRQEFVIGGYTDPGGSRTDTFGSLLLGVHDPDSDKLRYVGRVGTGFTATTLRELTRKMQALHTDTMPFAAVAGARSARKVHWIKPKLVGEVAFSDWTGDGLIRHASFQGLRADKPAVAITEEKPAAAADADRASKRRRATSQAPQVAGIAITHPERVIDAKSGATKLDLAHYYERIADLLLPHLRDRAVSLVRAPSGIDGPHFFQKHLDTTSIPHLRRLDPELFPGHPPLVAVDSPTALISCVQMNVVEFHTWNATIADMRHPDRMVYDLDPGEGITWEHMQEAAELTRALLAELGLDPFLKTSGGKGLHVIVPLEPRLDWDTVKSFSRAVVQHLAHTLPMLFVARSGPKNRVNRIFVDYLRNGLGATTVAAFSARARAGLSISVPVAWDDLPQLQSSAEWNIEDVEQVLRLSKKQPWKGYSHSHRDLSEAAQRLGFTLPQSPRRR